MKYWQMKNQCLQDEGVDCSSISSYESICVDFEGSQPFGNLQNSTQNAVTQPIKFHFIKISHQKEL